MISVVMAVYNGAKYLREQMDTIRLQSLPPQEVLFCDDGSDDGTQALIGDYIAQYGLAPAWRLLCNEEKLGCFANFDHALQLAAGEYIFLADQDDLWEPDKLERMMAVLREKPQIGLLCTDYTVFPAERVPLWKKKKKTADGSLEQLTLSAKNVPLRSLGCCMGVRRSFRDAMRDYRFDGWPHDDRLWRLALCADTCWLLHEPCVRHRLHDSNTATFTNYHNIDRRLRLLRDKLAAGHEMQRCLQQSGASTEKIRVVQRQIAMLALRIRLLEEGRIADAAALLRYLRDYETPRALPVELLLALKRRVSRTGRSVKETENTVRENRNGNGEK